MTARLDGLLPCPFCGGTVTTDDGCGEGGYGDSTWVVQCPQCYCMGPHNDAHPAAWNRRAAPMLDAERVEVVKLRRALWLAALVLSEASTANPAGWSQVWRKDVDRALASAREVLGDL